MFSFLFPAAKSKTSVRIKTLADLEVGETGRVVEVTAKEPLALHILEIGLVNGVSVRHLRSAPLGDPIQVEVDGFLLSLRKNEAEAVIVEIQE
ncbi:MAG TPA: ferrous iron transport protein A [candidate division Zixibacteria bacterium]|nr:ferrous iron transport protein A [candidate division Zixibacteria bacterium]